MGHAQSLGKHGGLSQGPSCEARVQPTSHWPLTLSTPGLLGTTVSFGLGGKALGWEYRGRVEKMDNQKAPDSSASLARGC